MFIDTHCHMSSEYYDDINLIYKENKEALIDKMIISLCTREEIKNCFRYINEYEDIYATIGYHPEEANYITSIDLDYMKELIQKNKKIVGIGEIGLDYHYGKDNINLQKDLFEKQLSMAEELNLPVVIHSRDAVKDTIDILKKYKVKGIIHCFSGSLEVANIYISMGFKLGIGGVLTFKNSKLSNVIEKISLENIVLETDSPYLTPEPFRGKTNSSKYIPIIAQKIADIKDISLQSVSTTTLENTYNLFDLDS